MTASLESLLSDVVTRCVRYLADLDERPVAPSPDAIAALRALDVPLDEAPVDARDVVRQLDEIGSPATMAMAGPRFFGLVIGGSLPAALAADWMTSAWDQNTCFFNVAPATAYLETVALRWLLDVLRLPPTSAGAFVTGTTVAHVVALAAARHAVLQSVGWNVEADGLFGAPPITVVVGDEAHPTLLKALAVIGVGRARVVRVATDGQGRMRVERLPALRGPAIVCAQVGNVNTGACDDVRAICVHAGESGAWVHVDGAFGLWGRVAPTRAHLLDGVEKANSWATDAHKWLNVPYDSGLAFVRDGEALRAAMAVTAAYLPSAAERRDPSDYTLESSRRARGVAIYAALRALGRSGVRELVERACRQARDFADGLRAAGATILNDVVLNQVLVSFGTAERTREVIGALQSEGTMWAGETVWHGQTAMRISVSSSATTDADVQRCLDAVRRAIER